MPNYQPNISFDLQKLDKKDWFLLGEIQSKIKHLCVTPLDDKIREELGTIFISKGINATTAIEGNTLTEQQVHDILNRQKTLQPSLNYLQQEVLNIESALKKVRSSLSEPLTPKLIGEWNKAVLSDLLLPEGCIAGDIRQYGVVVGNYCPPEAFDCPRLLQDFCDFYNNFYPPAKYKDYELALAVIKAILAHVFLVLIHPFGDGNGRTSRLLETRTLMSACIPYMSSQLLSNFYNKTRTKYVKELTRIWQFEESHIYPFISYALEGLVDEVREQIEVVNQQVTLKVVENDLYTYFKNHQSSTADRKRDLCLFILKHWKTPFSMDSLFKEPTIQQLYYGKTKRPFSSDLSALVSLGYVYVQASSVKSNQTESVITFAFSKWVEKLPEAHSAF